MKRIIIPIGNWKEAQGRRMQIFGDGTMFIDGARYLYQVKGDKLLITASDMKIKASYKFAGNTLYTTIKGNTNQWYPDLPVTAPNVTACQAATTEPGAKSSAAGALPEADAETSEANRNAEMLKNEFGLVCVNNLWTFYGRAIEELKDTLSDASSTYEIIRYARAKFIDDPLFMFGIVVASNNLLVFNKPEPVCFVTSLSTGDILDVIEEAMKEGASFREYNGVYVVRYD